jgi:CubicO group peptidase (beta-lactamase class C family)
MEASTRIKKTASAFLMIYLFSLGVYGLSTGESECGRQDQWPDTRAGRWGEALFKAYNTDGEEALRQFIKTYYSEAYLKENSIEEELKNGPLMLRQITGKITVHSVRADSEFIIDATVKTEKLGWVKFKIELSSDPPHDVAGMGPYAQIAAPDDAPAGREEPVPEAHRRYTEWRDLSDLLEQARQECGAPGIAAAIVQGDRIVNKAVTGIRRSDKTGKAEISDLWHVGSVTKILTAAMIGKLLDKGRLRWDMTIGEVLPEISMNGEYRNTTMKQLLGHLAGVPSMPSSGEFVSISPGAALRSPVQARAALVRQILTEPPSGTGEYSYSNSGYVVAGFMTEQVMQDTWENLMRRHVFQPLGLSSAGFGWPAASDRPDQPYGHYGAAPDLKVQEIGEYTVLDIDAFGPSANIHCSIEDFARIAVFYLHVLHGQDESLAPETVSRFWSAAEIDNGKRLFDHLGSGGTFLAMIAVYPDDDMAVVAAANIGLSAWEAFKKLRNSVYHRLTEQ